MRRWFFEDEKSRDILNLMSIKWSYGGWTDWLNRSPCSGFGFKTAWDDGETATVPYVPGQVDGRRRRNREKLRRRASDGLWFFLGHAQATMTIIYSLCHVFSTCLYVGLSWVDGMRRRKVFAVRQLLSRPCVAICAEALEDLFSLCNRCGVVFKPSSFQVGIGTLQKKTARSKRKGWKGLTPLVLSAVLAKV